MFRAGFAEADITPRAGSDKLGWLKRIIGDVVLNPLCAHIAVFEADGHRVAVISLDLLSIRFDGGRGVCVSRRTGMRPRRG